MAAFAILGMPTHQKLAREEPKVTGSPNHAMDITVAPLHINPREVHPNKKASLAAFSDSDGVDKGSFPKVDSRIIDSRIRVRC